MISPNFDPNPKDVIHLFGQKYVVQPHPFATLPMPYASEAGRAVVYQLRHKQGEYFALKVFRKKYRNPDLIESAQILHHVESFEGLRAAKRQVVRPTEPAAQRYRNLEYAMLMPWIHGKTWFDMLGRARENGYYPGLPVAIRLCDRFLEVIEGLETSGMAHTDISPGNVTVGFEPIDVQLLDLEEMYMPRASTPLQPTTGSLGYRHRNGDKGEITWRAEGDRYAAAVLAAEILILANPHLARQATDEGFFTDHHATPEGIARFQTAKPWLEEVAPEFAKIFEYSWFADSLERCPRISELQAPIKKLATHPPSPTVLVEPGVVTWQPFVVDDKQDGSVCTPTNSELSMVTVPNLTGQSYAKARSMIRAAGLQIGDQIRATNDKVPQERIVSQYPWAGAKAKRGATVSITISSGAQKKKAAKVPYDDSVWVQDTPPSTQEPPGTSPPSGGHRRQLITAEIVSVVALVLIFIVIIVIVSISAAHSKTTQAVTTGGPKVTEQPKGVVMQKKTP